MKRAAVTRALVAAAALAAIALVQARPASAACHAFVVTADPATVAEGGAVQVTVSRDAAVGPSQIDVETIDESARGGADYTAVARRTIAFSNETSQTFPVQTSDDSAQEGAETFRLHLSNPGGCAVNPNFDVGPDATVTIAANDDPDAPQPTAAPTTSRRPGTTAGTAAPGAPTTSDTDAGAMPPPVDSLPPGVSSETIDFPTTTADGDIALTEEDDEGSGGLVVLAVLAAVAALSGAGWWTWQRRRVRVVE